MVQSSRAEMVRRGTAILGALFWNSYALCVGTSQRYMEKKAVWTRKYFLEEKICVLSYWCSAE